MTVFVTLQNDVVVNGLFLARQNPEQVELAEDDPRVVAFKQTLPLFNPSVAASQAKASAKTILQNGKGPLMLATRAIVNLIRKEFNGVRENPTTTFPTITVAALSAALEAEIDSL